MGHDEIAKARREGLSNRKLVKLFRNIDLEIDPPEFTIHTTKKLEASFLRSGEDIPNTEGGDPVISGTTSSTDVDMYNSRMTKKAISSMLRDCKTHLTTFLNHDYQVPESILGSIISAKSVSRVGEDNVKYTDLDIISSVVAEDVNPRAMRCWKALRGGVKLGWSIGALVIEWEWQELDGSKIDVDTDDPWAMYFPPTEEAVLAIKDVLLLESSVVGMPANRRSWASDAARSILLLSGKYKLNNKGILIPKKDEEMSGVKARAAGRKPTTEPVVIATNSANGVISTDIYSDLPKVEGLDYGPITSITEEEYEEVVIENSVPETTAEVVVREREDVTFDPWEMVDRAIDLAIRSGKEMSKENAGHVLHAHDRSAHVLNMRCCGMEGCDGHEGDEDLSGREKKDSAHEDASDAGSGETGTDIDVEYNLDDLKLMKREFVALKAAHEHITKTFTDQIQQFKLQVDLSRAEAKEAQDQIKRLNEMPVGGRPTQQTGVAVVDNYLDYDGLVANAREHSEYESPYGSSK